MLAGVVILVILTIVMIAGSIILLREWNSRQAQVGHREPLPGLSYCSASQIRPCILSFNLDANRNMVINILTDGSFFSDFYMKVRHEEGEYIYKCQRARQFSINVSCTGETMPVGEPLQFLVVSTGEDIPLAQGSFPIIGLALATPEFAMTPTPIPFFNRPPK